MKKTTTRLATIGAAIIMGAFAIVLAQHDARNRERDQDAETTAFQSQPAQAIAVDEQWQSDRAIVRGNNDPIEDNHYENPLRTALAVSTDSNEAFNTTDYEPQEVGEVVTASGEDDGAAPPAWLSGVPSLPTELPSTSAEGANAANAPSNAGTTGLQELPSFPIGNTPIGGPAGNGLPSNVPSSNPLGPQSAPSDALPQLPRGGVAATPPISNPSATALPNTAAFSGQSASTAQPGTTTQPSTSANNPAFGQPASSGLPPANGLSDRSGLSGATSSGLPQSNTSGMQAAQRVNSGNQGAWPAPTPNRMESDGLTSGNLSQPPTGTTPFGGNAIPATPRGALPATDLAGDPAANPPSLPANMPQGGSSLSSSPFQQPTNGLNPAPLNNRLDPAALPNIGSNSASGAYTNAMSGQANNLGMSSVPGSAANSGVRAALVSNQPGSRYLDGSQNPIMLIQKRAPEEIRVGKRATFVIAVRNAGNATAHDVTVVDRVPQGARFAESSPPVSPTSDGLLTWKLGEMAAGDERTISLQIVPEVEGEVGSVASVHFAAQASVRTIATLPQIEIAIDSQGDVLIGDSQQIVVTIRNTGTGVAREVRLEADIPNLLRHESGDTQLEANIGDLRPNDSKRLTLSVAAIAPGQAQCAVRAVTEDGVQAEETLPIYVQSPQLAAAISGPSLRYLERQATYQIQVKNTGTAAANNLDFVVHLPTGLKFVSTDIPQGSYNPQTHTVNVGLAELAAGQTAPFSLTVLPVELGDQVIRFNASADLGVTAEAKGQVTVAGLAELAFTIGQDNGTVEVGASTTYSVQVTNVGNKSDSDVQLIVQLPEGAKLLAVDAPVDYKAESNRITFAPVAEMGNRDQKTFRFQVQHNRAGNQIVRTQLTSTNWPVAVVKEEGTLVYNDQN